MISKIKLGALRSSNFRWYFFGMGISLCGSWLQYIAIGWFIYHISQSAILLGFNSLVGTLPLLLLPPFFGNLIDKIDKRKLLLATQSLFFLQAFLLAILTISHNITYPILIIFSLIDGIIFSLDQPLRQAIIPQLIDKREDLPNAIAWSAFLNNFARILSPIIAGFLISQWNEGICFLVDSFSFLAMIFAIFKIKWVSSNFAPQKKPFWGTWYSGLTYIKNNVLIIQSLFLTFFASSTLGTYTILMPIITKYIYHGNASTQGYLLSFSGIGAVIASLFMTGQNTSIKTLIHKTILSAGVGILALIMLINTSLLGLGMLSMCLLGGGFITIMISLNSIIQLSVEEAKRGTVMSFFTMALLGATPLSNFFAGWLIDKIGIESTMNGLSAIFLISVIYFYIKTRTQANQLFLLSQE